MSAPTDPGRSAGPPQGPGYPQGPGQPQGPGHLPGPGRPQGYGNPQGPAPRAEPPSSVRIAYELWCVVAVLGIATTTGIVLRMSGMQDALVDEFQDRFPDGIGGQTVTREEIVSSLHISLGIIAVLGAVVIGLVWFFAHRMLRGRAWARAVLVGATAILVVLGFEGLLGYGAGGDDGGAAGSAGVIVMDVATILQAVLAVGASIVAHRGDSGAYFARRKPAP